MVENSIELIYKAVVGVIAGYFLWRVKTLEKKIEKSVDRKEVKEYVEEALRPHEVTLTYLREHLSEIRSDIKLLIQNSNK